VRRLRLGGRRDAEKTAMVTPVISSSKAVVDRLVMTKLATRARQQVVGEHR